MDGLPSWYDSWKLDYPKEWDSEEELCNHCDKTYQEDEMKEAGICNECWESLCCPICEAGPDECSCEDGDSTGNE